MASSRRSASCAPPARSCGPTWPTLTEQGIKGGVDFDVWFGLVAPAKTPSAAIALLNQKVAQIVTEPDFRKRLNELGGVSMTSGNTAQKPSTR